MALDPLFYFGTIEAATRDRATTADVWSRINDQAEAAGFASPGITVADVNRMRSQANAIRTADAQLATAPGHLNVDTSMVGTAPWARELGARNAVPMWQVRFQHETTVNGQTTRDWRTVMFTGALPPTVDTLTARMERNARQMAKDYGAGHVGIDSLSILAV